MDKEILELIDGEFVTFFESENDYFEGCSVLVTGHGMKEKDQFVILNFYLVESNDLSHGLGVFTFNDSEEAWNFLKKVPEMSVIDFLFKSSGGVPDINFSIDEI